MNYIADDTPIVASSTGLSENTAIGVIRLSGFPDTSYLKQFFKLNISEIEVRKATFCNLYFEEKLLDEVVVTFFKGPNSYNGENILEIAAHGNTFNLKRIIESFVLSGLFRLANNGEFTYRALKNRKLTLAQVEGLDSLLNASSSMMLDHGLDILNGKLFKKYNDLSTKFLKMKSAIELNIDFAEDVGEEESEILLSKSISDLAEVIESLTKSVNISKKSLLSPDVVLVGEPNAGKSSLFNLILNESRSIVSDIAGTTRDFITEYVSFSNNTFRLVDTAGLRETTDIIEEEGIKRSVNLLDEGFFKILLINVNDVENFDFDAVLDTHFDLIVFTHVDKLTIDLNIKNLLPRLPSADYYYASDVSSKNSNSKYIDFGPMGPVDNHSEEEYTSGSIEPVSKSGSIEPGNKIVGGSMGAIENGSIGPILKSGSIGPDGSDIVDQITTLIIKKFQQLTKDDPILIDRHRQKIREISTVFEVFSSNISELGDVGIISSEARILDSKISELIGVVSADDVLNNIFSNFCIGK